MPSTPTRTGNVVADVTALATRMQASAPTAQHTPAQYGTMAGYPGSKASALRQHIARQHGQGARATGHGRYPAVTPAQLLQLLGQGHLVRKPDATAQARKQASARVGATLWPKQRKAARKGGKQAKAGAVASVPTEPTAQASASMPLEGTAQWVAINGPQWPTEPTAQASE